ncbi:serine hydrolase [Kitasatospora sp. NPDC001660]
MTRIRRPRPADSRSTRRASAAALALTGLLSAAACSGTQSEPRAAAPAVTAGPAAPSPSDDSPPASPAPAGRVVPLTPDVTNKLDAAIKQVMSKVSIPGVTVSYTTPEGSYQRAFGVARTTTGTPMSPYGRMRIGSVTKTLTATAVLRLVDQGKVDLDDPISTYVPHVPGGEEITVRELGEMRSGLYNYTLDPDFQQAFFGNPNRTFTPDELLAYAFKHPANFPPDTKFEYSNTNLILLGLVVEKAGGQPLVDFMNQQVFGPAGLDSTTLPTGAAFPAPYAHGYTNQTLNGTVEDSTGSNSSWVWSAGAAISTLADLTTWSKVLATGAPLLKPDTQAERLRTRSVGTPDLGYGFGVFTTHGWIGDNGALPGYEAVVLYLPEAQASLVILLNTDIVHDGAEPSTFVARAITEIVSPDNVYTVPAPPGSASPSPSTGSPQPSAPATGSPQPSPGSPQPSAPETSAPRPSAPATSAPALHPV